MNPNGASLRISEPRKIDFATPGASADSNRRMAAPCFSLYHRLNVIRINTPPLRQRQEDIPLLLQHYLAEAAVELGSSAKSLDAGAMEALLTFSWPGNVRQRVNVARRLTVTAPGNVISAQDIPTDLGGTDRERHTGIREDTHRNHLGTHQRTPPGSGKAAGLGAQYVGAQDENLAPRLKQSD